jgi:hypothetical protein
MILLIGVGWGAVNSSLEAKNFTLFQNLVMMIVMNESTDAIYWSCDSVTDFLSLGSSKCQGMILKNRIVPFYFYCFPVSEAERT